MNVSDLQVPDGDDHQGEQSCSKTVKANNKIVKKRIRTMIPVSPANSQFVKERIWINLVTSKIEFQPLEPDSDAQLHEESVISVSIQPEICISSSTREMFQMKCGHNGNFLSI